MADTFTLPALIVRHSAANATLNRPGAELWPEQHAAASIELRETWAEITARFPAYVAGQNRLATWRRERERLIRAGEPAYGADAILDLPLAERWFMMIRPGDKPGALDSEGKPTGGGYAAQKVEEWLLDWCECHGVEAPGEAVSA